MSDYRRETSPPGRRTLTLLALATAIGSAGLAAGGTAGALLGVRITGTEAAAGLPLGLLVGGQAVAAVLVSGVTGRVGRGFSLALGYILGVIGALVVILDAVASSFALLLIGSTVLGGGNTAVFLTRYAAAEVGGDAIEDAGSILPRYLKRDPTASTPRRFSRLMATRTSARTGALQAPRWLYGKAQLSSERPSVLFDLAARLLERKVLATNSDCSPVIGAGSYATAT